jgi:hypothetical protein
VSPVHCTDTEGTKLRIAVPESSIVDTLETNQWYQFEGVTRAASRGAELLCRPENGNIERTDRPESHTNPPLADRDGSWLTQLERSEEVVALTVQPRPTDGVVRADDPETFEIGAVCLTHCGETGDTAVYHREEAATRDEHLLLEHVAEDLSAGTTLLTYGGTNRPLELLYRRLALAGEGDVVPAGAEQALEQCFHADAARVVARAGANTLVEFAEQLGVETGAVRLGHYDVGLDPADWRDGWEIEPTPLSSVSDPQMIDRDYAALVERYLATGDGSANQTQLAQCLKAYASADLDVLHGLVRENVATQLGCPRLAGRLSDRS